jgi:hypothetical protein
MVPPETGYVVTMATTPQSDLQHSGPVPEEQQVGHHDPAGDQDKPDADAFAARLGVLPEGDEPADAPALTEVEPHEPLAITAIRKRRRALALAIAMPAAAFVVIRQILRRR